MDRIGSQVGTTDALSGNMYTRSLITSMLCAVALLIPGCAAETDPDGDDESEAPQDDVDGEGEDVGQTSQALSGRGRAFADAARRTANQMSGTGRCMLGVRLALESVPGVPNFKRFGSAYQWGDYYQTHQAELANHGLKRQPMNSQNAPVGSVLVYGKGMCGANRTHGHIEIVVGGGLACSDYCAPIRNCNPVRVFPPL